MREPDDSWLTPAAEAALIDLGDGFAEAIAELRQVLADGDIREEIGGLTLLAVRSPDDLADGVDALATVLVIFCPMASQMLDLARIVVLVLVGQGIKRSLRAGMN